jgi:hypothetical protein
MIEHGSRERRKRARTRERETSGRARLAVHFCAEARDERATVGDVDVMRARGERRFRDTVVLPLERACAVNHDVRRSGAQPRSKIRSGEIELQVGPRPAARSKHFDPGIAG